MLRRSTLLVLLGLMWAGSALSGAEPLQEIHFTSTLEGSQQPALFWAPESARTEATPLLVLLHTWSGNYRQDNRVWHEPAQSRGWIYLQPDFRGRNDSPEACGSALARQDILDAMAFVEENYRVDHDRIYLAGTSGGGHMAMRMAVYPRARMSAVSP